MITSRIYLSIFVCLFLFSCSTQNKLTDRVKNWDPYQYRVQYGDTLYSIAWRYDLDFKSIASWNNIKSPFTIYPGQKITMRGPEIESAEKTYLFTPADRATPESEPMVQAPDYSDPENIPEAPPVKSDEKKKQAVPERRKWVKPSKKTTVAKIQNKPQVVSKPVILPKGKISWSWPIKGKVVSTFAANNHERKGIDIKGHANQKIKAAGTGVVVYSGAGLLSYGNLIIIKHSDRYLSAYAHNKKLLVKEGTQVNKGQTIAIIGKKSNVTNLLHFEIRKNGKPVNPLVYLP